jgi:hypothetical protein
VAYTGLAAVAPTAVIAGSTVVEHIAAAAPNLLVPGTVTAAAPTVTG